jgi:hypothetical protein
MSDTKQFLSIVIPVYCEEDVIGEFYSRLKKALVGAGHGQRDRLCR